MNRSGNTNHTRRLSNLFRRPNKRLDRSSHAEGRRPRSNRREVQLNFSLLEPRQMLTADFLGSFGGFGSGTGELHGPWGIAINDSVDNVYVAELVNDRVQIFDRDGNFEGTFGGSGSGIGQMNAPIDVALDAAGNVYVVEQLNHRVQVFDGNGNYLRHFGTQGSATGQFSYPSAISVLDNGDIYVGDLLNERLQVFSNSGIFKFEFGVPNSRPLAIAHDSNDNIYVADPRNDQIHSYDLNGNLLDSFGTHGTGAGEFDTPGGLFFDDNNTPSDPSDDSLFVTELKNHRVQVFDLHGNFKYAFGEYGSDNSEFIEAADVAVADDGRIYVSEWANIGEHRVQIFQPPAAAVSVTPLSGLKTSESGDQAQIDVILTAEPTANVVIDVTSSNPSEGTVLTSQLVFTPSNWNTVQSIHVAGVDDGLADEDIEYTIHLEPVTSGDPRYANYDPSDVRIVNLDDEAPLLLAEQFEEEFGTTTKPGPSMDKTHGLSIRSARCRRAARMLPISGGQLPTRR